MNLGALFTGGRDRAGTMKNVIPWQMPRKTGGAGDEGPLRRGGLGIPAGTRKARNFRTGSWPGSPLRRGEAFQSPPLLAPKRL